MTEKIKFTVATVTYNAANVIKRTLDSVEEQDYPYVEHLMIDGNSHDGTVAEFLHYQERNAREARHEVNAVSEPDKGIYDAMNKGILRSEGTIIGIVNSDDWLETDTLQTVWEENRYCEHSNRTIIAGEILFHYSTGLTQLYPISQKIYESKSRNFEMGLNHPATFVPRFVYDTVGLFDVNFKLKADADFILRWVVEHRGKSSS